MYACNTSVYCPHFACISWESLYVSKLYEIVTYGRGLVLLQQCYDKLSISGFVDDVVFVHRSPAADDAKRARVCDEIKLCVYSATH